LAAWSMVVSRGGGLEARLGVVLVLAYALAGCCS
jgi:hypothetical protein